MSYSPALGGLVLFGGLFETNTPSGAIYESDTWIFDGEWTNLSLSGPSGRSWSQLSPEPTVGDGILFGGYTNAPNGESAESLGDTWGFDGALWEEFDIAAPSPRYWAAMAYDAADGYVLLYGGASCVYYVFPCGAPTPLGDTWAFSMGDVAPLVTVNVAPTAICVANDSSCAAGTWQAEVNVTVRPAYSPRPLGGGSLENPVITVLPWGEIRLDSVSPPLVSCHWSHPDPKSCDRDPAFLTVGESEGFRLNWSSNPYLDSLFVGDVWSVEFGITVAGPPYGSVPVYACDTPRCLGVGCGPIAGSFSSISLQPNTAEPPHSDSLPYASIAVDPPGPQSSRGTQPIAPSPPPGPSVPIGLPTPVALPTPVPAPFPVAPAVALPISGISLTAIAAGVLAAGFARVALRRRSIAVGQPVGNPVRSRPSAFEAERPSDPKVGRFV
jgi:hypothetical protein